MKNKRPAPGLKIFALLVLPAFIGGYAGSLFAFGANAPWWWLGGLGLLTLLKLTAALVLTLFVLFFNGPVKPPKLTGADYEFTIQREGRPYTFNVVPTAPPHATPTQKRVTLLFLLLGIGLALWPEWVALGAVHHLWVLDTGTPQMGRVTALRAVARGRNSTDFYLTYTYLLPNEEMLVREQQISSQFYAQLAVGNTVTVRYRPENPAGGYVEDPDRPTVFFQVLGLPWILNMLGGWLALSVLRNMGPDLWRGWQRRRTATI